MSCRWRRCVSAVLALHFAALLTAVVAVPGRQTPAPRLAVLAHQPVRPYLQALNLTCPYHVVVPATTASCPDAPTKRCGRTPPPMFGDIITCGFNQGFQSFQQFNGGFQQFQGGLNQGFQGFQQGFQQFNQGFQQFNQGFQGQQFNGFNQGFNQGFQGFQGVPFSLPRSGTVPVGAVLAAANSGSLPASYALPQTFRGPFKIAHNESPRPQDRVHIQ